MSRDLIVDLLVAAGALVVLWLLLLHFMTRWEEETILLAEVGPDLPPMEPLRNAAEAAEVADKTAWIAGMAEAMTVRDNLANPLDLEVVNRLDRLQGEEYANFAANVDAALAAFTTYPVEPHQETGREFVDRAGLSAWSLSLTGSFKTISLSSDTQEITREQLASVLEGAR